MSLELRVERLARSHDRTPFVSGAVELDEWFAKYSWQNQRDNNATTYVGLVGERVVGYYALTLATYARSQSPSEIAKNAPEQVPCLLLARLAVDLAAQGQRVGTWLLSDVMRRSAQLSRQAAFRALLVHSRDDAAREFYLSKAEFIQSPVDPLHLFLPTKIIVERFQGLTQASS